MPACGNKNCKVSSTIAECPSFGSGKLDEYGFWEFPCGICARAWEKEHPKDGECWPFARKQEEEKDDLNVYKEKLNKFDVLLDVAAHTLVIMDCSSLPTCPWSQLDWCDPNKDHHCESSSDIRVHRMECWKKYLLWRMEREHGDGRS